MKTLQSKRFLVRKSLINTNTIIEVTFKNGKSAKYASMMKHIEVMKEKLNAMNCWEKYKSYTSSSSIPVSVRSVLITD